MYLDIVEFARVYVFAILTFLFFAILLFDKESRKISIVILSLSIIFLISPELDESLNDIDYHNATLDAIYVVIGYCGAAMLAVMFDEDKKSKRHAILFACVILLHVMLSSWVIDGEYFWNHYSFDKYNEILIVIAIIQMWVSRDGIIRIYHGIQAYHSRDRVLNGNYHTEAKRIQTMEEGKRT